MAIKNLVEDIVFSTIDEIIKEEKYLDGTDFEKFIVQDQKRLSLVVKKMGKLE